MEFLLRWSCVLCSNSPSQSCPSCEGKQYIEAWVPFALIKDLNTKPEKNFVIMGQREIGCEQPLKAKAH